MRENRLRKLIDKGQPTLGTQILIPWPGLMEIIGQTGIFDYAEFLSEYAPFDLHDLDNLARAAELANLSPMIKIEQQPRTFLAERALAAGIQNIFFADIRTVEDAKEAVRAVRSEPKGMSGYRMDRRAGYVFSTTTPGDIIKMGEDAVVAIMIEKNSAVENLEEILSTEGIDMVEFGPSDYALSLGMPGEKSHPKVKEAELKTITTAVRMGIPVRAEVRMPSDAERYIELGVHHICLSTDVLILHHWLKENGEELRRIISKARSSKD